MLRIMFAHVNLSLSLSLSLCVSHTHTQWKGVLLNWSMEFEGYKRKIEKSFEIRENFDVSPYMHAHILLQSFIFAKNSILN